MRVHLDHNSTTPMRAEVRARWLEVADEHLGNPSSLHASGRRARAVVDEARARVAAALGVHEEEIYFASGATEANNLAVFGAVEAAGPGAGLVTTAVEHSSVLEPALSLAEAGRSVAFVPVDPEGLPDPGRVVDASAAMERGLVSVAAANNETGAVPDLLAITSGIRERRARLRIPPMRQALGRLPCASAVGRGPAFGAQLGGPPGVGVLWRARGSPRSARTAAARARRATRHRRAGHRGRRWRSSSRCASNPLSRSGPRTWLATSGPDFPRAFPACASSVLRSTPSNDFPTRCACSFRTPTEKCSSRASISRVSR
jgi:cysteine desulfurase